MRKTPDKSRLRAILHNIQPRLFKNAKIIRNKEKKKSVKLSQPKGMQSSSVCRDLNETLEQKTDIRKN